ncbi:similar to Torulaspora delbrueckii TDEL_0F03290 hypothetical protein [Maudiozyma saulgeensis]|uniref:Glutamyl-tRNA(Gln) amidotransferase subunit F, mitochondrial n=1 Tax=Maudiozyma saulgeensis TaxID=1789683 RepID=A0A1X7QXA3_9SACH|nr:similar to Torulaspora delbrueckii TDEL_0F03290 hypothetical protein [Kazachstania saulgeensis]
MPLLNQIKPFLKGSIIRCKIQLPSRYFYSSQVTVGQKFKSLEEIKQFMESPSWSLKEFLTEPDSSDNLPSPATVKKLLRLSGFSVENANIKKIQQILGKQLLLLQSLQEAPLDDETVDTMFARIMPRVPKPLDYKALLSKIKEQKDNKYEDELSGSWNSTGNTEKSKNGYFVVTKKTTPTQT